MAQFGFDSTAEDVTDGLDLSGQTWLITGVNSGLGLETARVLGLRGARIVGAARTVDKAKAALDELGVDGRPVSCELSDIPDVRRCVDELSDESLAGIIANAGIMALPELTQKDGLELQFLTNHVGHFVLVTGLLGQLQSDARVVILSSGAHFRATRGLELHNLDGSDDYDPWRAYGRSKLANVVFASELAKRLEGTGQTANSVHPGVIQTNLSRHIEDAGSLFASLKNRLKTVGQGAATQCYVAVHPDVASISGRYFADCAEAETLAVASDPASGPTLWQATEDLLERL
ncbi:MAG: SDR family NAD(P)-dependent oxidoreductase [Myxococcota bacterium]